MTYLLTRRCSQREFLLSPCEATTGVFGYVLAVAARRYRIAIHAFCVMSNHYHLVVTDPFARLPAFCQYLDAIVARALNHAHDRSEDFWAPNTYSAVALETPQDVTDKVAYVLANPVAAGLVRHGREWRGLWSDPRRIDGAPFAWARPGAFFRKKGSMPASEELTLTRPAGFATTAEFADAVIGALTQREEDAAATLFAEGRTVRGVAGAFSHYPESRRSRRARIRQLNPRVACRDKWLRIAALQRLTTFVSDYRAALKAWCQGIRDVEFPAGTYLMRLHHRACCAGTE